MKENFREALKIVLELEGGYVNDPADPGGATMFGITQRVYDEFLRNYGEFKWSVKDISREAVESIYYDQYWTPAGCNKLPPGLDIFHFVTAVNVGVNSAGRLLQRAINSSETTGIKTDGIIGPETIKALKLAPLALALSHYVNYLRELYDIKIEKNKNLEKFRKGWMNRVDRLAEMCLVK